MAATRGSRPILRWIQSGIKPRKTHQGNPGGDDPQDRMSSHANRSHGSGPCFAILSPSRHEKPRATRLAPTESPAGPAVPSPHRPPLYPPITMAKTVTRLQVAKEAIQIHGWSPAAGWRSAGWVAVIPFTRAATTPFHPLFREGRSRHGTSTGRQASAWKPWPSPSSGCPSRPRPSQRPTVPSAEALGLPAPLAAMALLPQHQGVARGHRQGGRQLLDRLPIELIDDFLNPGAGNGQMAERTRGLPPRGRLGQPFGIRPGQVASNTSSQ